jgi:hypothetical protein
LCRSGSSTKRYDAEAARSVAINPMMCIEGLSNPIVQRSTTNTGQCHRYREYERLPIQTGTGLENK